MLTQTDVSEECASRAVGSEPRFPDLYIGHHSQGGRWNRRMFLEYSVRPCHRKALWDCSRLHPGAFRAGAKCSKLTEQPSRGLWVLPHHTQTLVPWVLIVALPSSQGTTQCAAHLATPGRVLQSIPGEPGKRPHRRATACRQPLKGVPGGSLLFGVAVAGAR